LAVDPELGILGKWSGLPLTGSSAFVDVQDGVSLRHNSGRESVVWLCRSGGSERGLGLRLLSGYKLSQSLQPVELSGILSGDGIGETRNPENGLVHGGLEALDVQG
jgi:hypothetical protein